MHDQPNRQLALDQYRLRARFYDAELAAFEPVRRRAMACLALQPGDTVLDVGCGTGLSFELLQHGVGQQGRLVGIEQSPDMLQLAQQRVLQHQWRNVTLLNAPVKSATLTGQADAALFHFTHDILRQPAEIRHVLAHLKPGARVVAAGLQWSAPWNWPTNWLVLMAALYSTTSLEGLAQPWSHLTELVGEMRQVPSPMPGVFIVSGHFSPKGSEVVDHV